MPTAAPASPVARMVRPLVRSLHAYVPGEQPKIPGLIKLNTNENPYPPAPGVLRAVRKAADGRLRLYPNPTSSSLREKLARLHGCEPSNVFVGNGSDEVLACLIRAFVEPAAAVPEGRRAKATVQYLWPCYSLYPVLAETHGALARAVPLEAAVQPEMLRVSPSTSVSLERMLSCVVPLSSATVAASAYATSGAM